MKMCLICGRPLPKSHGLIGPKCLARLRGGKIKTSRIATDKYVKYISKHDLFPDEEEDIDGSGDPEEASNKSEA